MQYINSINYEAVDAQVIGIIIAIPVTGVEEQPMIAKYNRCDNCKRQSQDYNKFCSFCGGNIIKVTDKVESYGGYQTDNVPLPDVRKEMAELGIDNHLPFHEDCEEDVWKFVFKKYETIGNDYDYIPFVKKLDLKQIQNDLIEAEEKFKTIIEKYNGKVIFGIAGEFADW